MFRHLAEASDAKLFTNSAFLESELRMRELYLHKSMSAKRQGQVPLNTYRVGFPLATGVLA